jgi:ABC-type phosphate transport system substrate-binding protein
MRRITFMLFAAALLAAASDAPRTRVSFIVSAKRPVKNVSSAELGRIFLGQTSRWPDGHRIVLYVRPSNTPEGRVFLDRVVHMADIDYSQWWIGAVFRGQAAAAPRVVETAEAMLKLVAADTDAIGFIAAGAPADVVVLTVDGKAPSDAAYPIGR